jgi:16S rRNA (adenine1518-N6/adenine1519-N6)-dimethyltransferase
MTRTPNAPDSPAAILRRHGLYAKKGLGQCFLHDRSVVERMVARAGITGEHTVVEIGPGLGILTRVLVSAAGRVLAIERDPDMVAVLAAELPATEVVQQDALDLDLSRVIEDFGMEPPLQIMGNLPYNITSPLLFHLLDQRRCWASATFMVQKEVAQRLCAGPGQGKVYGAPSVICQRLARVELLFMVGRGAFHPAPRVDSAVVHLALRAAPLVEVDDAPFARVVRAAFNQRRKTLRKALSSKFTKERVELALERSDMDGRRRGETLTIEEFGALTQAITADAT